MSTEHVEDICEHDLQRNVRIVESTESEESEKPKLQSISPETIDEEENPIEEVVEKKVDFDISTEDEFDDVFEKTKYRSTSPDKIRVNRPINQEILNKYIKKAPSESPENISKSKSSSSVPPLEPMIIINPKTIQTEVKVTKGNSPNKNGNKQAVKTEKKKKKEEKISKSKIAVPTVQPLISTNPLAVLEGVTEYGDGITKKFVVNPYYRSSSEDSEETFGRKITTLHSSAEHGESSTYVFNYEELPRRISLCERLFNFIRLKRTRKED